jgi:uncharacterized membrane protein
MNNWSLVKALLVCLVVAAILVFALRSCKAFEIKQKSTDKKASLTVEIEKEKPKEPTESTNE